MTFRAKVLQFKTSRTVHKVVEGDLKRSMRGAWGAMIEEFAYTVE